MVSRLLIGRALCGRRGLYVTPKGHIHHRGGLKGPKGAKLGETFAKGLYLGFGARSGQYGGCIHTRDSGLQELRAVKAVDVLLGFNSLSELTIGGKIV